MTRECLVQKNSRTPCRTWCRIQRTHGDDVRHWTLTLFRAACTITRTRFAT